MPKDLDRWDKFLIFCIARSVRHPRSQITYIICGKCKARYAASNPTCPKCGCKNEARNPTEVKRASPIPWQGSIFLIVLGTILWATLGLHGQEGLVEVARFLIYTPMGVLFGLSKKS